MLCQLAYTYSPTRIYNTENWWVSPKYDGVRCLFLPGRGLLSRTLKLNFVGFPEIENICNQIAGDFVLDGELFIPGEKFDVISGIARKRTRYNPEDKARMQFHVFALWKEGMTWTTEEMISEIVNIVPPGQSKVLAVSQHKIANNPKEIQFNLESVRDAGLSEEGIMLRSDRTPYHQGRSHDLVKVKNFSRSDFTVVDATKGSGKYAKSLGRLIVEGQIDQVLVRAGIGTGFTDAERQEIWDNKPSFIGRNVEIIYLGATAKSLRHPVFSRFI